jgi:hypothetical protein
MEYYNLILLPGSTYLCFQRNKISNEKALESTEPFYAFKSFLKIGIDMNKK